MNVFGFDGKLPQLTKNHQIQTLATSGEVIDSYKIVLDCFKLMLQPIAIQFNLHIPLTYFCHFL